MHDELNQIKQQLQQLRSLQADGTLSEASAQAASAPLEQRLVALVLAAGPAEAAAMAAPALAPLPVGRQPLWPWLAGGLVVLAAAGYWWASSASTSAPLAAAEGMGKAPAAAAPASAPHAMGQTQILTMVERLAERLKTQPDDADGWGMLARSYTALGRQDEALAAYQRALKLRPDDALTQADYAAVLAARGRGALPPAATPK